MADPVVPQIITRNYGERLTLDLDASLPGTRPGGCLSLKNVIRRNGRGLSKRPGTRMICSNEYSGSASTAIHCGLFTHAYSDDADGVTEDLYSLGVASNIISVSRITTGSISVNYTGAGTASMSILANASGLWEVSLYVDGVAVSGWPKTYDNGLSPISGNRSIGTLVSDIDALANWAATDSSTTNARSGVAQIGTLPLTNLVAASTPDLSIPYNKPEAETYFPSLASIVGPNVDQLNFENLKGTNAQNCAYVPLGKRLPILKFDGQHPYRPGLPRAVISSIADTGAGATHAAGNTYIYRVGFRRIDAKGNVIYGPYSDDTLAVAEHTVGGAPTNITLTIRNLEDSSTNATYGADGKYHGPASATVNGNQVGVTTVTVNANDGLIAGDTVYFLNQATGQYVTKTLTAATFTTLTFSGAVNVNNGDFMSNIIIDIHRTENDGIDFFLLASIPNTAITGTSTQTYVDAITDANLGDDVEEQIKLPEAPPNAAFCCTHQGLVVYACLEDDPTGFCWNDPQWGLEAFPSATNRDQVIGQSGGPITAIISESDQSLAIFKARSYFRIQGDLAAGQYTITEVGENRLGVASHSSLVKMETGIYGISQEGPVVIQDGTISLLPFSDGVGSYFEGLRYTTAPAENVAISASDEGKLVPRRSTGAYWPEHNVVLFFIPAEEGTTNFIGGSTAILRYANESSLWLCYDVEAREWREWEFEDPGINAHLAMHSFKEELYFLSTNSFDGTGTASPKNHVWKFLSDDSVYNYADNADPIEWAPRLQWESLGLPSSEKKMTQVKLYMRHASDFLASFDIDVNEYQNGDSATKYTQASRTFSASTDREKIIEAIPGSFESNAIEFYNTELYQCPVLSGFEVGYAVTAAPQIKDTKGD